MAAELRIDSLCKRFGNTCAVDHITVTVEPGELFFLLGPSGCGKTTLLRCIAGLCEPDSGSIRMAGRDITRVAPHDRDAAMVFQSYALWPHMTVGENVAFGLEMRRMPKRELAGRVGDALDMVRMREHAGRKPGQLSGGQQQRVALARALVIRPECLLLDEPLSNLDANLRMEMRAEIRRICKEAGLTAVYVTHDQKEALAIADRLAVMHEGRMVQVGNPRELYKNPCNRFVAGFIGETNFISGRVAGDAGGCVRVETALGRMECSMATAKPLSNGSPVTLSIRPEVLRFDAPPTGGANVLPAIVHDSVYLGEMAQHLLRLDAREGGGCVEWKAFDLNPRFIARDQAASARVWIAPEDIVVLTD
jgi:iron(III) transport system ATP-binding protein